MKTKLLLSLILLLTLSVFSVNAQSIEQLYKDGKKAFFADKFDEANDLFSKILAMNSDNYEVCFYKGLVYEINFDNERAITELTKAMSYSPKKADPYYSRASIYEKLEKYDEALEDYTTALKYDKNNAEIYFGRGSVYQLKKDYRRAIKDFTKALKQDPFDDIALYNRGLCHKALNENEEAIEDFENTIKIDKAWENQLRPVIEQLQKGK